MAHPSQRDDPAPGHSRFATPPPPPLPAPAPPSPAAVAAVAAPVFVATVVSEPDGNPDAEPSLSHHKPLDNPKFLHPATPRKAKISTLDVLHKHKGYYSEMAHREMEGRYAQVSLKEFFGDYVPKLATPLSERQSRAVGDFSRAPYSGAEEPMYAPLCETFQRLRKAISSPYTVLDTSGRSDRANGLQDTKPDLSLYDGTHGLAKYSLGDEERMASQVGDERRREHLGRTAWAWMVSFIEVKSAQNSAPFNFDDTGTFEVKETDGGKRSRAQVIKYVSEIQHRQHRTFVLCAFIWRDWVRFMRWDRAGAIVSAAVNYVENPQPLLDFVHGISTSFPEGQGYDPTVTLVDHSEPDVQNRLESIRTHLTLRYHIDVFDDAFRKVDMNDYPLYQLTCEDVPYRAEDRADNERTFPEPRTYAYWISKIHAGTRSPTGRGTKGFVAIDLDHRQIVFLKDYWCANVPGVHPELETYARLRQSKVGNVAAALAGGIVGEPNGQRQTTATQEILKAIRGNKYVVPPELFHYRFVVREIGQPLETYERASHLWLIIVDCIIAHEDAYKKAGVLHRDISARNILINPLTNEALIIDWDLAKYRGIDGTLESHQSGRSGTWPFMSAKLLQLPKKPNDLADDLESFIYVICVMVLCYHDHNLSPTTSASDVKEFSPEANARNAALSKYLHEMFYSNVVSGRYHTGGKQKLERAKSGDPEFEPSDKCLQTWISGLYQLLKEHYAAFPVKELQGQWGVEARAMHTPNLHKSVLGDQLKGFGRDVGALRKRRQAQTKPKAGPSHTSLLNDRQAQLESKAGPSQTAFSPPSDTQFEGLYTHALIYDVCTSEDLLGLEWPDTCDKTPSQFSHLPNPNGTHGTEVACSLAGSSAGSSKHSLGLDEGDKAQEPNPKKSRKEPTRAEQGLMPLRRSIRQRKPPK